MKDLDKFKNEMNLSGQNVYVGHRYVPKIMGDWDKTQIYEPLSIVQYQGNSFTSRQRVPSGVELTNEEYWASTGNYNAQIEQYRQDVRNLESDINTINDEVIDARRPYGKEAYDTLGDRLQVYEDSNDKYNKTRSSTLSVSDFGAYGSNLGNSSTIDESKQINEAIQYAMSNNIAEVVFPSKYYRMDEPMVKLTRRIELKGLKSHTFIDYHANKNGYFIENAVVYSILSNLYITVHDNGYEVSVLESYNERRSNWGGRIQLYNTVFKGYSMYGAKIYAPHNNNWENADFIGGTDIGIPEGIKPPETKRIGLFLCGYDVENGVNVFGNVNQFNNSKFYNNKIAVKMINVGGSQFNSSTFENNWVNIYAPKESPATLNYVSDNVVNGGWFENDNRTNKAHPESSVLITGTLNEETGVITYPPTILSNQFKLNQCHFHNSVSLGRECFNTSGSLMKHPTKALGQINSYKEKIPFYQVMSSDDVAFMDLNSKENFFLKDIRTSGGYKTDSITTNNSGYKYVYFDSRETWKTGRYTFGVTNPSFFAPDADLVVVESIIRANTTDGHYVVTKSRAVLDLELNKMFEGSTEFLGGNVDASYLNKIDDKNSGSKVIYKESTKEVSLEIDVKDSTFCNALTTIEAYKF